MPTERTGLLVIRAYLERGSSSPLRAEIRLTSDVSMGIERTVNLVDPEVAVQVVRAWLHGLLEGMPVSSGRHAGVT
jgi:hypothetical protein